MIIIITSTCKIRISEFLMKNMMPRNFIYIQTNKSIKDRIIAFTVSNCSNFSVNSFLATSVFGIQYYANLDALQYWYR